MSDPTEYWDKRRNKIYSDVGGWVMDQGAYTHELNLLDGVLGNYSYIQVHTLNVTGRMPSRELADWMECVFIFQSWPDARIWCNQIGALGGETRCSPTAAVAAGIQAASSELYSGRSIYRACGFIRTAMNDLRAGKSIEDIVEAEIARRRGRVDIAGYTRPIATGDERVEQLWEHTRNLGFDIGEHEILSLEIERYLFEVHDERMNLSGCIAAFMSDQGFNEDELYQVSAYIVSSGVEACYLDAAKKPQGSFLPLRCDDIEYVGRELRSVDS